ncbi:MAG: hypothetical protein K2L42_04485, partial [Clostridia bacterium]|nr:hypothetical protein [Clostridia bacterium]
AAMNRGFCYYYGRAVKKSAAAIYKNKGFFKYYIYLFMELLARSTIIFSAVFDISDIRFAKYADKQKLTVTQSFTSAGRKGALGTMILTIILEAFLFLAGVMLICVFAALLGAVGYAVSFAVRSADYRIFIAAFAAPAALALVAYVVILPILLAPTPYIIESNPEVTAGEVIALCMQTMKTRGKWTLFMIVFVTALAVGVFGGLGYGGFCLIEEFLFGTRAFEAVFIIWEVAVFIAFALAFPVFDGARRIATVNLFADICAGKNRIEGVNIKRCKGIKIDPEEIENGLSELFDETEEEIVPLPEKPADKRRREREERAAAKLKQKEIYEQPPKPVKNEAQPAIEELPQVNLQPADELTAIEQSEEQTERVAEENAAELETHAALDLEEQKEETASAEAAAVTENTALGEPAEADEAAENAEGRE